MCWMMNSLNLRVVISNEDEIGIDDAVDNVSESNGLAATASQTTEWRLDENCPVLIH